MAIGLPSSFFFSTAEIIFSGPGTRFRCGNDHVSWSQDRFCEAGLPAGRKTNQRALPAPTPLVKKEA